MKKSKCKKNIVIVPIGDAFDMDINHRLYLDNDNNLRLNYKDRYYHSFDEPLYSLNRIAKAIKDDIKCKEIKAFHEAYVRMLKRQGV